MARSLNYEFVNVPVQTRTGRKVQAVRQKCQRRLLIGPPGIGLTWDQIFHSHSIQLNDGNRITTSKYVFKDTLTAFKDCQLISNKVYGFDEYRIYYCWKYNRIGIKLFEPV